MSWVAIAELKRQCASRSAGVRLRALGTMREQLLQRSVSAYLRIAARLMNDRSENCRWHATIVVGEFLESHSEEIWSVLLSHLEDGQPDTHEMLGTVLLEHLLPVDFQRFFPRIEARIHAGDVHLRAVLQACWRFGETESEWNKVRRLQSFSDLQNECR